MPRAVRELRDRSVVSTFFLCALICVIATGGIIFILLRDASNFFQYVRVLDFLTGTQWQPAAAEPKYGVLPLITGTLLVTVISGLVALPLGLAVGIFLSEYASLKLKRVLKPVLELLAGIPSVVFGYFALYLVTPLLQIFVPSISPSNAVAAGIVVGLMTLPFVASLCEDAISSVPKVMREAAYGLGSTKAEVITKIVVPSALSGVVAAFILALSRAVGEVMAVTIAAGARPSLTFNPGEEVMTMTAYIVNVSRGDAPRGTVQYDTIFAVGLTLFAITLAMNLIARSLIRKYKRGYAS